VLVDGAPVPFAMAEQRLSVDVPPGGPRQLDIEL
jgi:hypothetical protein